MGIGHAAVDAENESVGASVRMAERDATRRRELAVRVALSAASIPLAILSPAIGLPLSVVLIVFGVAGLMKRPSRADRRLMSLGLALAVAGLVAGLTVLALASPGGASPHGVTDLVVISDDSDPGS